jgi:hypothetical protein
MAKKYLIVEGYYDYLFYKSLFEKFAIKQIEILKPQDAKIPYGGKGNAVKLLGRLVPQFRDGRAERILIVLDADFKDICNEGFHKTLGTIHDEVKMYGYDVFTQPAKYAEGIVLKSSKGLPDIAVWIMPDNSNEGYLESLLIEIMNYSNQACIREAKEICHSLKNRRFKAHHQHKAILALFMAMQDNPGRNATHLVEKEHIDFDNGKIKRFIDFIQSYYR